MATIAPLTDHVRPAPSSPTVDDVLLRALPMQSQLPRIPEEPLQRPRPRSTQEPGAKYILLSVIGMLHLGLTLYSSTRFLASSSSSLTNDFFWADFNATDGGVLITRAFTTMLRGSMNATFQLSDDVFGVSDPMARRTSSSFSPAYVRMLQYDRLTSVEDGIAGLRQTNSVSTVFLTANYCWVDFGRRWSLAHTARRAERCLESQKDNGAVYFESLLRNIDWTTFEQGWSNEFATGIGNALLETVEGRQFLDATTNHTMVSISQEASYWRSKGIRRYILQYSNAWDIGIEEKINVVNAFGFKFPFTIKRRERATRWSAQTTMKMYWTVASDMWAVVDNNTRASGYSLVREAPNFYGHANLTMEQILIDDGNIPVPLPLQDEVFRQVVGPFNAIDLHWVRYPDELFSFVLDVRRTVLHQVRHNTTAESAFLKVTSNAVGVVPNPVAWSNGEWALMGGSPLCSKALSAPYVSYQFLFDDTCGSVFQETVSVDSMSAIFVVLASGLDLDAVGASCALIPDSMRCTAIFSRASVFISQFLSEQDIDRLQSTGLRIGTALAALNISIIQFAKRLRSDNSTEQTILRQPLLTVIPNTTSTTTTEATWDLMGWQYVYEWVWAGNREVVSFEGDHGTLVLISSKIQPTAIVPSTAEVPQTASIYLLLVVQYVTLVLVVVAAVVIIYATIHCFRIAGLNLLAFNRVAGVVWVGRPLLFLRGVVAVGILSSARLRTTIPGASVLWMTDDPQQWLTSIITAGEATWLLYVAIDVCLVFTSGVTHVFAPLASAVVWATIGILQIVSPVDHEATVTLTCTVSGLQAQIICTAGSLFIGNPTRLVTILVVIGVTMLLCLGAVRCCVQRRVSDGHNGGGRELLLPSIAHEMFMRSGWVYQHDWYVDPASSVMTGLVPIRIGPVARVFDIKSWMLFRLHQDTIVMEDDDIQSITIPPRPARMRGALRLGRRALKSA